MVQMKTETSAVQLQASAMLGWIKTFAREQHGRAGRGRHQA